jgi:hypothetical protein
MHCRVVIVVMVVALGSACDHAPGAPTRASPPDILAASVAPLAHSVLGALATVRAQRGTTARVRFQLAGAAPAEADTSPAVRLTSDSASILVLGLHAGRRYTTRVEVDGPGGTAVGEPLAFDTGLLPSDLPRYDAGGPDPTPGFVVFAAGRYGVVIDNAGRVVWYREFPANIGLSFMAEPNGRYFLRPQTPEPDDLEPWLEVDPSGAITRTLGCAAGLQPRPHDLIAERDGAWWIMCDEARSMDLRAFGGAANARVTGTVVQHVGADGTLRFQWSPFDHFAITDLEPAQRTGASVNWTHGNAIELDARGHLLVSFRNLSEITSIDTTTGRVRWRLGGRANQFAFVGQAAPSFAGQHGIRAFPDGSLLVFDNVGNPVESRVEGYQLDEARRTARTTLSYGSAAPALTTTGGSVQALPGGRTLVSFGTAGRVEEHDAAGALLWHVVGHAGYVFRAQRIVSLYAPGVGTAR